MLKYNLYQENGSGRDTYISFNNGGNTMANSVSRPGNASRSPSRAQPVILSGSASKTIHYMQDGTGRDSYIGWNSGGQHNVCPRKH